MAANTLTTCRRLSGSQIQGPDRTVRPPLRDWPIGGRRPALHLCPPRRPPERIGIRPDTLFNLFPSHGRRHREAFARTGRVSADRCCAAAIAEVVEVDSIAAPRRQWRNGIGVRPRRFQPRDQRFAVEPSLVMAEARLYRHHEVQALSAGQFRPALIPLILQHGLKPQRGLHDERPRDPRPRVKIEDEPVRTFDIINGGGPGMQLDRIHLDKADQPLDVVHPHPYALAAFPLLDTELMDGIRDRRQVALMIERRAVRMPHQLQRSPAKIIKRALADLVPIPDQFLLRWREGIWQQLENVFARDSSMTCLAG